MNKQPVQCEAFILRDLPGLDPVTVFVVDFEPGKGMLTVECYGHAWSTYMGAMAGLTIAQFFAQCGDDYLTGRLLSGLQRSVTKTERGWVARITPHVIAAFKAGAA